jgi:hypothetical protein
MPPALRQQLLEDNVVIPVAPSLPSESNR